MLFVIAHEIVYTIVSVKNGVENVKEYNFKC